MLCWPFGELLWQLDKLFLYTKRSEMPPPLFIIGCPRSGTTFLHRTLAADEETFFAIKYIEWRYPYMIVWYLLDLFPFLRRWAEQQSYWPSTNIGALASGMHPHTFGDYEEHGIYMEEKFFSHYFVFRRFPFPKVLDVGRVDQIHHMKLVEMANRLITVATKVYQYRGRGRRWVTKENESTNFNFVLAAGFLSSQILFIIRNKAAAERSYDHLSRASTCAKTGLDPIRIKGWHEANREFRREEHQHFTSRCMCSYAPLILFEYLIKEPYDAIHTLYRDLNIEMPRAYHDYLRDLTLAQQQRAAE